MPDLAIVTVMLNRLTGEVEIDDTFSTPMETWGMLATAAEQIAERISPR